MAEEAPKYYAVLTDAGAALEARALAEGKGIVLTHIAVGDADLETVTPDPAVTQLVHEVHRRPIDARSRDEQDPKVTLLHATIPADVGGFWINELGVVGHLEGEEEEVLYAYANHGRYYKMLPQDGQTITHELTIPVVQSTDARIVIEVADDGYASRLELLQLSGIVEDLRRNREAVWTLDAPVEEGGTLPAIRVSSLKKFLRRKSWSQTPYVCFSLRRPGARCACWYVRTASSRSCRGNPSRRMWRIASRRWNSAWTRRHSSNLNNLKMEKNIMAEPLKMQLKDVAGTPVYPVTSADQVKTADGGNVEAKLAALQATFASGIRQKGTVGTGGTVETLPAGSYTQGDMYIVKTGGTYAGQVCEPGDLILCIKTFEEEAADSTVAKDSGVKMSDLGDVVAKKHQHANAALLDGISADGETATINGKTFHAGRMVAVIEAGGEIPADMNPGGIVFEKVAAGPAA